jgi:PPK2 family polyphosphate:nucleotide phosphotransferase
VSEDSDAEFGRKQIRALAAELRVKPGKSVKLRKDFDPGFTGGFDDEAGAGAEELLRQGIELLADYQQRLSAQDQYGVLVVLQGMDAAGKDGIVKHVFSGVNPQSVEVRSFKVPSTEELNQDYLRRYQAKLPERGRMGIFNRSHYEEVLVVRVHKEVLAAQHLPPECAADGIWKRRFRDINAWERYLVENGIHVVKLFLNLSREEQKRRFLDRIEEPDKNWKFTPADIHEREYWDDYQKAFSDVLSETSTEWAPWHVVPADHKWFARLAAAAVIVDALIAIDPQYPTVTPADKRAMAAAEKELLAESD